MSHPLLTKNGFATNKNSFDSYKGKSSIAAHPMGRYTFNFKGLDFNNVIAYLRYYHSYLVGTVNPTLLVLFKFQAQTIRIDLANVRLHVV